MLAEGAAAPNFQLPDSDMNVVSLESFRGSKNIVLYFYPKDDTPGCTMEAVEFSDLLDVFQKSNTVIVGISRDTCNSHGAFRDKYGLTVQLLADVDGQTCRDYGVWQEREKNGEKRMTVVRSTFVIDKEGIIRHALYDVKPKGHADTVLQIIKGL